MTCFGILYYIWSIDNWKHVNPKKQKSDSRNNRYWSFSIYVILYHVLFSFSKTKMEEGWNEQHVVKVFLPVKDRWGKKTKNPILDFFLIEKKIQFILTGQFVEQNFAHQILQSCLACRFFRALCLAIHCKDWERDASSDS